jgi:hypothetical protein
MSALHLYQLKTKRYCCQLVIFFFKNIFSWHGCLQALQEVWGFEITQPGRIYFLYAATEAERMYWCEGLVEQIARIKHAAGEFEIKNLCI